MKLNIFSILILGFAVLIFFNTSCTSLRTASTTKENNSVNDTLTGEKEFDFRYNLFEATKYYEEGNFDLALSIFGECLKLDPNSAVVYYNLANIYLNKGDMANAEANITKCISLNDKNVWYLRLGAGVYAKQKKFDQSIEVFKQLIKVEPDNMDNYLGLADVLTQSGNLKEALKVYDNVDKVFGITQPIALQKSKIYLALGKKEEALNELKKLAAANNNGIDYLRMIGDYYLQLNEPDKAIELYDSILESTPDDGYSHIGLAEAYRTKGDLSKVYSELKFAFNSQSLPSDIKFSMLINLIQNSGDDADTQAQLFDLTKGLVKQYPDDMDIQTIYANYLLQTNQFDEARYVLRKITSVRKDKFEIWQQLVSLDYQKQDWDSMFLESSEALEYFPNQDILYFLNGFSAFQLNKYSECLKSLEFGYKLITKTDPKRLDFLTFMGEASYKLNEKEKAYHYFDELLKADPENFGILNNYAYYLSLDKTDLDKAEQMSKKTIDAEPQNSTYLDTYAWILFCEKKYVKSLEYIEKAVQFNQDSSSVIVEHYGDILYFNNRISDAIEQWKHALTLGDGSGLLNEKIDKKKYIE